MPPKRPRFGSLQYWPRKRAQRFLPRVNWSDIEPKIKEGQGLLGVIAYKAGMRSVIVKDDTATSMTKGKKIVVPGTVLEIPPFGVYSVRFYNKGLVVKDVVVANDKELKRYVKVPKTVKTLDSEVPAVYDDVRLVIYTKVSKIGIKKTPDMLEVAIKAADKLALAKQLSTRELTMKDVLLTGLFDARGLTKGKGLVGPVKRFGISLKSHKAEKGVRRPGSLGPWHPAHVTFRTPISGQMGMFTRVHRNLKMLFSGNAAQHAITPVSGFTQYGVVKGDYVIVQGSVSGPQKRQVFLAAASRPTKKLAKRKFEFVEVI
ncbi:MAG TPA: 50S ribosomal protein L3 [Candidatus Nanoarchaeia archaeon]|nr:50S ribosomal protein L3 [Candidatus Nanoarchaeia archaeon]